MYLWILLSWDAGLSDVRADTLTVSVCEGEHESVVSWVSALYLCAIYNRGPL